MAAFARVASRRISTFAFLAASLFFALSAPAFAAVADKPAPFGDELKGKAYVVRDLQSGETLAALNADQSVEPASLTKLMTAYLVFEALADGRIRLDDVVTPSEKATKMAGSRMFVEPGKPVAVEDLIKGLIVQSGNDAAVALAETVAGSEDAFVERMNAAAKRLGMTGTRFENASGMPGETHRSTAADLALLSEAIMRDFPDRYHYYSIKEFTFNKIRQSNRNTLLFSDPNVDGLKTGHTQSAGFNLIASSHRDGRRVLSVLIGSDSEKRRAADSSRLLNWAIDSFATTKLFSGGAPITELRVYKGKGNKLKVGFFGDMYVSLPKNVSQAQLGTALTFTQPLVAPIAKGQKIGTLTVTVNGTAHSQRDVFALEDIQAAGWIGRVWDSILLWARSFFD